MKIVLADNLDPGLPGTIDGLAREQHEYCVAAVYGKPTSSEYVGSGRPNSMYRCMERPEAEERARLFLDLGMEYDYSLNDPDPKVQVKENREKIIEEMEWIESSPISAMTVSGLEMIRLARNYAPTTNITVSIIAGVDGPGKMMDYAKEPNVKTVVADKSTYKDLGLLREIVDAGKEYGTSVRVIANLGCMSRCIRTHEHHAAKAAISKGQELINSPISFFCMTKMLENPRLFLNLPVIWPSELGMYEGIGVDSIKLVDRTQTTEWNMWVAGYYLRGTDPDNMLGLTCVYAVLGLPEIANEDVAGIDIDEVLSSHEEIARYRQNLPGYMGVRFARGIDPSSVGDNFEIITDESGSGSAVIYDPKRRDIVLGQLHKLNESLSS